MSGQQAGTFLFKAKQPTAAAIVLAMTAMTAPDDPAVLTPLGASLAGGVGVFVRKPFVHWATRTLLRSIAVGKEGPFVKVATEILADLRTMEEWQEGLTPLEPGDLEEMLVFLDIDPMIVVEGIDAAPENDQMFLVMALGDMASPRLVPVVAAAISGRWGAAPVRSALKRFRPFANRKSIRDALVALRAGPLAAEAGPYLDYAERDLPTEIIDDTPKPKRASAPAPAKTDVAKPWWKFW